MLTAKQPGADPVIFPASLLSYIKLGEIQTVSTAHSAGSKKVLSPGRPDLTRVTQIAWGTLAPGDEIPLHAHPDMDECFFFIRGSGTITVSGLEYALLEGVFINVPAGAAHSLKCIETNLEFFYFGLQVYSSQQAE